MWQKVQDILVPNGEWWRIIAFFGAILGSLVVGKLSQFVMERSAKAEGGKQPGWVKVLLKSLAKPTVFLLFAVGWWIGICFLAVRSPGAEELLETISQVLYAVAIGYALYAVVDIVDYYLTGMADRTASKVDDVLAPLVGRSIRITIFVLVVVNVIHVVTDKSITTIIAGLGVGGLAVALAGQDTIKNFFGSVVILADKPFEIGDRIVVDGHDGPVEHVGFRSTKIRTLSGHLVTIPNSEMVNTSVVNISKRPYIKRVLNVAVTYDTPPEKVEEAVTILKDLLKDHEGMDPEFPARVFFSDYGDWSLNILVLYWYHPPEYWQYMEFSVRLNMKILERFNKAGIEFAFPTQTLWLERGESGNG